MSEATPCIQVLRKLRRKLAAQGDLVGIRYMNRGIAALRRELGDRHDLISELEIESARMPLDPPADAK
ncbi:MAG: hypothetical protein V4792_16655 [Pseudomonadota bacterium]